MSRGHPDGRTPVVLITRNRRAELPRTLAPPRRPPERPRVPVTDDASTDGTAEASARDFPETTLLCPGRDRTIGRDLAVRQVRTRHVALPPGTTAGGSRTAPSGAPACSTPGRDSRIAAVTARSAPVPRRRDPVPPEPEHRPAAPERARGSSPARRHGG
ncbi:glycosyltransferase family 2 protein [Streptomyces collinus]